MPYIRVTHQTGAITAQQRADLAEDLTHALLIAEAGADTPDGRSLAYVFFEEISPSSHWFVGGKPDANAPAGGRFLIDVVLPEGAAPQDARIALHAAINDSIARIIGVDGTFPNRASDWVVIREIANGSWGAGGKTLRVQDIAGIVRWVPERTPHFEGLLAAQKRLREAHGFPAGFGFI